MPRLWRVPPAVAEAQLRHLDDTLHSPALAPARAGLADLGDGDLPVRLRRAHRGLRRARDHHEACAADVGASARRRDGLLAEAWAWVLDVRRRLERDALTHPEAARRLRTRSPIHRIRSPRARSMIAALRQVLPELADCGLPPDAHARDPDLAAAGRGHLDVLDRWEADHDPLEDALAGARRRVLDAVAHGEVVAGQLLADVALLRRRGVSAPGLDLRVLHHHWATRPKR